jgi:DNA polymerase V
MDLIHFTGIFPYFCDMEIKQAGRIKKSDARYEAEVSKQTGFPSPATHYLEPSIDLNKELTTTKDATFFVRTKGNGWSKFKILDNDVLIIDRSMTAYKDNLVLVIEEGAFNIIRINFRASGQSLVVWGVITYIIHSVR